MVTQEYTYAYAAVSVEDGAMDSLVLPRVNADCMQIFLDEIASRYPEDRIIMVMDGAGWHQGVTPPANLHLVRLPPLFSGTQSGRTYLGRNSRKILPQPRF